MALIPDAKNSGRKPFPKSKDVAVSSSGNITERLFSPGSSRSIFSRVQGDFPLAENPCTPGTESGV
jgi:hypothetical protein